MPAAFSAASTQQWPGWSQAAQLSTAVRVRPHPTPCTTVGQGLSKIGEAAVSSCHPHPAGLAPAPSPLPHPSSSSLPWDSTRGQGLCSLRPPAGQGPAVPQQLAGATLSPWPGSHQPARPRPLLPGWHGSGPRGYLNLPEIERELGAGGGRARGVGPQAMEEVPSMRAGDG